MPWCPTGKTTKKKSQIKHSLTNLNSARNDATRNGNRYDTKGTRCCIMLEVCEVRSYLPKTDDNDKTHKNDANTLS